MRKVELDRARRLEEGLFDGDPALREQFAQYLTENGLLGQGVEDFDIHDTLNDLVFACLETFGGKLEAWTWAKAKAEADQRDEEADRAA